MKKSAAFFTIVLVPLIQSWPARSGSPPRLTTVAVTEFRTDGVPPGLQALGKSFPDALITELGRSRAVRIVEREFYEKIVAELNLQQSALIDDRSKAQSGRLLGARLVVAGAISVLKENLVARARLISVENNEVLGDVEAAGTLDNIFSIQKSLARQVAAKLAIQIKLPALEVSPMTINAYQDLEHLRALAGDLPILGLDPARARKKSDYVLALSLCDKLAAAYPQLAPARYYRALFSLHQEDFAAADTESQIAQQLDPDDLETLLLRGNFLAATNDRKGAVAALREAKEKFPEDSRAWYALGVLYLEAGAKLEAIAAYLAAIERQPLIAEAEANLQTMLESAEGLALLARLKEKKPEAYPAAAVFYAFWKNAGNRLGDLAERAMNAFPNLYLGYYMQGVLARDRQQYDEAATLFQACLELRPAFPEVHRELGLLALSAKRCTEGAQHFKVYLNTANFVDDYAALEEQVQRCQKRR